MTAGLTAEPLTGEWVRELVALTGDRVPVSGLNGVVGFGIGKTTKVVVAIDRGVVVGESEATPEVEIFFTKAQLAAWVSGTFSPTLAYMKGDLKPVGASGPLVAALELLDSSLLR